MSVHLEISWRVLSDDQEIASGVVQSHEVDDNADEETDDEQQDSAAIALPYRTSVLAPGASMPFSV
jgi:hypothetical protein